MIPVPDKTKRVCDLKKDDVFKWQGVEFIVKEVNGRIYYDYWSTKARCMQKRSFGINNQMRVELVYEKPVRVKY